VNPSPDAKRSSGDRFRLLPARAARLPRTVARERAPRAVSWPPTRFIPVTLDHEPSRLARRARARSRANASGSRAAREGKELIPDPDEPGSSGSGMSRHKARPAPALQRSTLNSTRRFCWRPALVRFDAIGVVSP
jgi:hypothetical protein